MSGEMKTMFVCGIGLC